MEENSQITESEYLKAKAIVNEYEGKAHKNIAVIALNRSDFNLWKFNSFSYFENSSCGKFSNSNCTYYCIINPNDLCSYTFDGFIETEHAKENPNYDKIIEIIKPTLKSCNEK